MDRVNVIRRQIQSGQYRCYLDRNPEVLDQIVERATLDVLREELERHGEDVPPVLYGQGAFERPHWPKPGIAPHRGWWLAAFAVGLCFWIWLFRVWL